MIPDDYDDVVAPNIIKGTWNCLICGLECCNKKSARRHFATQHQENKPIQCQICNRYFKNWRSHYEHCRKFHGLKKDDLKILSNN